MRRNILVVDDAEDVRAVLTRLLALHEYNTATASNGAEAIDLLQKSHYDLLIIDQKMPVMSGRDAIEVIRSSPKFQNLKILMLTVTNVLKDVEEAYELGINGYITKPFDMAKLLVKIERVLVK